MIRTSWGKDFTRHSTLQQHRRQQLSGKCQLIKMQPGGISALGRAHQCSLREQVLTHCTAESLGWGKTISSSKFS